MKFGWMATAIVAMGCGALAPQNVRGAGSASNTWHSASELVTDADMTGPFARLLFPDGRRKALIISCDDGRAYDRQLVRIMNQYGIRGTFNLITIGLDKYGYVMREEVKALYAGHEVACHTVSHQPLSKLPDERVRREILDNRADLERLVGYPVRGLAYPGGDEDDRVIALLPSLGIVYGRCVSVSDWFRLPSSPYKWVTTCTFSGRLMDDADQFLNRTNAPSLMLVWGHSFDFGQNNTWDRLEKFCAKVGRRDDVWYATCIELIDYVAAEKNVKINADDTLFENTNAIPLWIELNGKAVKLEPGKIVNASGQAFNDVQPGS